MSTEDSDSLDLGGWDADQMFNFRDWLIKALEDKGAKNFDTGGGLGGADIWFKLEGAEFFIRASPVLKPD